MRPCRFRQRASDSQSAGGSGGTRHAHEMEERAQQSAVEMSLKDIAVCRATAMAMSRGMIRRLIRCQRSRPRSRCACWRKLGDMHSFIERAEVYQARWIPPEWQDMAAELGVVTNALNTRPLRTLG